MIRIKDIFIYCPLRHFKEVKYFSLDGRSLPNGVGFQRGNFLKECADNARNFALSNLLREGCGCRGGVIIFPSEATSSSLNHDAIKQCIATFSQQYFPLTYTIGNAFRGNYIGTHGEVYNESSTTIEVDGLPRSDFFRSADFIARALHQRSLILKDLNSNKIYGYK